MITPLITIIVPVFNVEKYIERCLLSCLYQTYKNIEILVINDGSPDNSQTIINAIAKTDSRVSVFTQINIGLGFTRNRGIDLAKGEYLFFLDSDDWLPEDAIEQLVSHCDTNLDIIVGNFLRADSNEKIYFNAEVEENIIEDVCKTSINDRYHFFFDHEHILTCACNKLYSTSFVKSKHIYFSSNSKIYAEDLLFNLKIFMCLPRIKIVNIYTYFYFINVDSITSNYKEKMAMRWCNLIDEYIDEINKKDANSEFENILPLIFGIAFSNISYNVLKYKFSDNRLHRLEFEIFYSRTYRYFDKKFILVLKQVDNKLWGLYYIVFMKLFFHKKIEIAVKIQKICMKVNSKL